jgi:hypothetical protein
MCRGNYLMVSANSTCRWVHIKPLTVPDTTTGDRELLTLRAQAAGGAVALTMAVWSARWIRDGHRIVWHGRR